MFLVRYCFRDMVGWGGDCLQRVRKDHITRDEAYLHWMVSGSKGMYRCWEIWAAHERQKETKMITKWLQSMISARIGNNVNYQTPLIIKGNIWRGGRELNPRPLAWQASVLTELNYHPTFSAGKSNGRRNRDRTCDLSLVRATPTDVKDYHILEILSKPYYQGYLPDRQLLCLTLYSHRLTIQKLYNEKRKGDITWQRLQI